MVVEVCKQDTSEISQTTRLQPMCHSPPPPPSNGPHPLPTPTPTTTITTTTATTSTFLLSPHVLLLHHAPFSPSKALKLGVDHRSSSPIRRPSSRGGALLWTSSAIDHHHHPRHLDLRCRTLPLLLLLLLLIYRSLIQKRGSHRQLKTRLEVAAATMMSPAIAGRCPSTFRLPARPGGYSSLKGNLKESDRK